MELTIDEFMNDKFKFDSSSRIWLYGAATTGVITQVYLNQFSYNIEGFIDRRADEINYLGDKKVLSLERIEKCIDIIEEIIVIIAVKNVFEHERIASELVEHKIHNIIFFPYASLNGGGTLNEKQLYNISNIISKKQDLIECILPKTFTFTEINLLDKSIIKEKDNGKIVILPINLIFTDKNMKTDKLINNKIETKNEVLNKNILTLCTHIDFFEFLLGNENAEYERYIDFCENAAHKVNKFETTIKWRENVFRNRVEVFENMNLEYENNSDFFINSAPDVEWNDKGYFNLISGKHRAAFLVAKHNWYIPVKINNDEYNKLFDEKIISDIKNIICIQKIRLFHAPVEHPLFFNIPCDGRTFWYNSLRKIALELFNNNFIYDNSEILIDIDEMGFLARFFSRMNAKVNKYKNKTEYEILEKSINNLLFCNNIEWLEYEAGRMNFDCIFVDNYEKYKDLKCNIKFYFLNKKVCNYSLKQINSGANKGSPVWVYMEK